MLVDVDGDRLPLQKPAETFDLESPEVATHMVRVIVRNEGSDNGIAVISGSVEKTVYIPCRVDHERLAPLGIAEQIHEVGHLPGGGIGTGHLSATKELSEIEGIVSHHSVPPLRTPSIA
jgi:hypothetical protein